LSESKLEQDCTDLASQSGCRVRKVKYIGRRDAVDRQIHVPGWLSMTGHPFVWFVEFKSPNKKGDTSPGQDLEIKWLRDAGFAVHVVDDYDLFEKLFYLMTRQLRD